MSNIPMKPGYYWAKLRVPAEGTHEAELWGFNDTWEIVQVNANRSDWDDDPAEDEALSVAVPGIRETQWRECFVWGEFIAPLENARPKPAKKAPSDAEWRRAIDCAASQFETYFHNDELNTFKQRRAALDDAFQHAFGLLSLSAGDRHDG